MTTDHQHCNTKNAYMNLVREHPLYDHRIKRQKMMNNSSSHNSYGSKPAASPKKQLDKNHNGSTDDVSVQQQQQRQVLFNLSLSSSNSNASSKEQDIFVMRRNNKHDNQITTPAANSAIRISQDDSKQEIDSYDDNHHNNDNFSLSDLDNPQKPPVWKPIALGHRWAVGDTVEIKCFCSELPDFCEIIGTNPDGTYNMQDIITGRFKKFFPEHRILGTYDDLIEAEARAAQLQRKIDGTMSKIDTVANSEQRTNKNDPQIILALDRKQHNDVDGAISSSSSSSDDDEDFLKRIASKKIRPLDTNVFTAIAPIKNKSQHPNPHLKHHSSYHTDFSSSDEEVHLVTTPLTRKSLDNSKSNVIASKKYTDHPLKSSSNYSSSNSSSDEESALVKKTILATKNQSLKYYSKHNKYGNYSSSSSSSSDEIEDFSDDNDSTSTSSCGSAGGKTTTLKQTIETLPKGIISKSKSNKDNPITLESTEENKLVLKNNDKSLSLIGSTGSESARLPLDQATKKNDKKDINTRLKNNDKSSLTSSLTSSSKDAVPPSFQCQSTKESNGQSEKALSKSVADDLPFTSEKKQLLSQNSTMNDAGQDEDVVQNKNEDDDSTDTENEDFYLATSTAISSDGSKAATIPMFIPVQAQLPVSSPLTSSQASEKNIEQEGVWI